MLSARPVSFKDVGKLAQSCQITGLRNMRFKTLKEVGPR